MPQERERRQAGAEVIEREAAPQVAQPVHESLGARHVGHRCVLGELENEQSGLEPTGADLIDHEIAERLVVQ